MTARFTVCDGCCCGRTEKGNNEVPVDFLRSEWKKHELKNDVKLTISGCLGPCKMNNVSLITFNGNRIWLGKLNGEEHYGALVAWAQKIASGSLETEIPEILIEHQFIPTSAI